MIIKKLDWSRYENLGFNYPFFSIDSLGKYKISNQFNDFLDVNKELDLTAVVEMLNFNYFLGDRTLLKGVSKAPFFAKFNSQSNQFEYRKLIMGTDNMQKELIVKTLYNLLQNEMIEYIADRANIGVLLSGGMDSRIVLGILNSLIVEGKVAKNLNIQLFTWGLPNSRDVIYAKEIAKRLKLNIKTFLVGEEDIYNNIEYSINNGLEYSPLHLHAMLRIANEKNLDCILAGSFGDSIGRAQYSGTKVGFLVPHEIRFKNNNYLVNEKLKKDVYTTCQSDIAQYRKVFKQKEEYQNIELEYQIHYMRRMINTVMMSIDNNINLYQMFASPKLYEFVWSLDCQSRHNDFYKGLFNLFYVKLHDIPYAKTGLPYLSKDGTPDGFLKDHHKYKEQIQLYFKQYIENRIFKTNFLDFGIVNKDVVLTAFNGMDRFSWKKNYYYEEKLMWLAMLSEFIKRNNIIVERNEIRTSTKGRLMYFYHQFRNS